jgi:hypothetical protein
MTNAMGTRFSMAPPVAVQNKLYERPQPAKRSPPLAHRTLPSGLVGARLQPWDMHKVVLW